MSMLVVMVKTAAGPTTIGGFLQTSSCRNLFSDREINQQKRKVIPKTKGCFAICAMVQTWCMGDSKNYGLGLSFDTHETS
jgi:hypothetical protein